MTKRERDRLKARHLTPKQLAEELQRRELQKNPPVTKAAMPRKAVPYAGSVRQRLNTGKHKPRSRGPATLAERLGLSAKPSPFRRHKRVPVVMDRGNWGPLCS